jgi:hypothetical protein
MQKTLPRMFHGSDVPDEVITRSSGGAFYRITAFCLLLAFRIAISVAGWISYSKAVCLSRSVCGPAWLALLQGLPTSSWALRRRCQAAGLPSGLGTTL